MTAAIAACVAAPISCPAGHYTATIEDPTEFIVWDDESDIHVPLFGAGQTS